MKKMDEMKNKMAEKAVRKRLNGQPLEIYAGMLGGMWALAIDMDYHVEYKKAEARVKVEKIVDRIIEAGEAKNWIEVEKGIKSITKKKTDGKNTTRHIDKKYFERMDKYLASA